MNIEFFLSMIVVIFVFYSFDFEAVFIKILRLEPYLKICMPVEGDNTCKNMYSKPPKVV